MSTKLIITAMALLTALATPALAADGAHKKAAKAPAARVVAPPSFGNARGAVGDFTGYPTDFLTNRFGDRQAQGRL